MKMDDAKSPTWENDDMLPEYDLEGEKGVRGKYYDAYRQGHEVRIEQPGGTTVTHLFTLEDGAVLLEPDVRRHFASAQAVNEALRAWLVLSPELRHATGKA